MFVLEHAYLVAEVAVVSVEWKGEKVEIIIFSKKAFFWSLGQTEDRCLVHTLHHHRKYNRQPATINLVRGIFFLALCLSTEIFRLVEGVRARS